MPALDFQPWSFYSALFVSEAEKFFSVTLAKEKLSPAAEIERTLLADKFRKLKTQLGLQNELSGGGKGPPRPPKGKVPVPAPVLAASDDLGGEELYDDVAGIYFPILFLEI